MPNRIVCLLFAFTLIGCAAARAPVAVSNQDPASPDAWEPAPDPPPSLAAEPAMEAPAAEAESPSHHHHPPPAETSPESVEMDYACPMHPQVRQAEPGVCSICGMKLVPKAKPPKDER